jgi:hypothetical protein
MGRFEDPSLYGRLFEHVSRLKVVVILTTPRAGSDFFQSLLDGHPQVLQIPGQFQFYPFWENALCKESLPDLIGEFLWHRRHVGKFRSRYEKEERWDRLGDARDEHFEVDMAAFERHMLELMAGRAVTSRNFFLAAHAAYCLAAGRSDLLESRLLVCHLHEPYSLPPFHKDFPDYDVIYCTRDPRNTLVSTFENIMLELDQVDLKFFRFWLRWIVLDAEQVASSTRRITELPLERLHGASEPILRQLCQDFGIEFHPCLLQSTWSGKRWWGDARSKRFLDGFNPKVGEARWEGKLGGLDVLILERLLARRMALHGYAATVPQNSWRWRLAPGLFWWPMAYERKLARHTIQEQGNLLRKATAAVECFCEYLARVRFVYGYFRRDRKGQVYVAQAVTAPTQSLRVKREAAELAGVEA